MKSFRGREEAVSSVIGVTLMVGQTVLMVSIIAASVFAFSLPEKGPGAKIVISDATGNIDVLHENTIELKHKGGDRIYRNSTKILITGKGKAYTGSAPSQVQDIRVTYRDLSGNNYGGLHGSNLGEIVQGNTWDAGEKITLYGYDGKNINSHITDQGNTVSSKWRLEKGTKVDVYVIDIPTDQIIAFSRATIN